MRKLRVMLEIDVADIPKKERQLHADALKVGERELPRAENHKAADIAAILEKDGPLLGLKTKYTEFKGTRVLSAAWFGA